MENTLHGLDEHINRVQNVTPINSLQGPEEEGFSITKRDCAFTGVGAVLALVTVWGIGKYKESDDETSDAKSEKKTTKDKSSDSKKK